MGAKLTKSSIDLGIATNNGPAMLAFYRDVLGFPLLREMPMPGGGAHMHHFSCGESVLKLVVTDKPLPKPEPGGALKAAGFRYVTITVSNLSEVVKEVADAGHKVVIPERQLRPGVTIAMVEDPDGNWVEFLALG